MQAQPGKWLYPDDMFTDQKPREIAELAVREKLLEHLPQEMPYKIKTNLEMWEKSESGKIFVLLYYNKLINQ
jgi:GTPase Era involved in 16S rRNA processing